MALVPERAFTDAVIQAKREAAKPTHRLATLRAR